MVRFPILAVVFYYPRVLLSCATESLSKSRLYTFVDAVNG